MKKIVRNLFLAFLGIGFILYLAVTAIADLTNTKDVHTVSVDGAFSLLEVEHSINGLIPVGKDHYYFAMNQTTYDACVIKGTPGWYRKNFDAETGKTLNPNGVEVTALSKRVSDYDIRDEIIARASRIEGVRYVTEPGYSLELDYRWNAIGKLALLATMAVVIVWGAMIAKRGKTISKTETKVYLVFVIVFLVLLLKVIL